MKYTKPNLTYLCILTFIISVGIFDQMTSKAIPESEKIEVNFEENSEEQAELSSNKFQKETP